MSGSRQFLGKYRGKVTDIADPSKIGRIKAQVPDVTGSGATGWAMPCVPFGGASMGFFALPKVGAGVWIEFERGDPDYPIWTGCWFGAEGDLPSDFKAELGKVVMIQTEGGSKITIDDRSDTKGIILETSGGQKIKLNKDGIEIDNGKGAKIKLDSSTVKVNDGSLEVM